MSSAGTPHGPPPNALTDDLMAVVRRLDPAWTGYIDSDPGVTLLEIGAWLTERLGAGATAARPDPYRDFNFRVEWDGVAIGSVTRISALRRAAEIVEHREGSAPDLVVRTPGRLTYQPFALVRPLGADTAFEDWADQLRDRSVGTAPGGATPWRKNIRIEVLDHAGRLFLAYDVYGCWPLSYRVLPDLTESLTLLPTDWQRDRSARSVA